MGLRPRDVLRGELAVEIDGGVDFLHDFGGAGGEASAPHLVAHVSLALDYGMSVKKSMLRRTVPVLAPVLLAAVVWAVLYGKPSAPGKVEAECSAASKAVAAKLAPLAKGEIAALAVDAKPRPALDLAFDAPDGKKLTLADFKGRALLLNLWATWCVPCRAEMPALDRLQAKAGGPDFEVVAINVDTARSRTRAGVSGRNRRQEPDALRRSQRRRVRGAAALGQGARSADQPLDRQAGLRDRRRGRAGRLGRAGRGRGGRGAEGWVRTRVTADAEGASRSLQAFSPSFSKNLWFQCQAFPKNVLAVLWDFNRLQ